MNSLVNTDDPPPNEQVVTPTSPDLPEHITLATETAVEHIRIAKLTGQTLIELRKCVSTDLRAIHLRLGRLTELSVERFENLEARVGLLGGTPSNEPTSTQTLVGLSSEKTAEGSSALSTTSNITTASEKDSQKTDNKDNMKSPLGRFLWFLQPRHLVPTSTARHTHQQQFDRHHQRTNRTTPKRRPGLQEPHPRKARPITSTS
ncbi:hypothetical protein GCK72_026247 [Caenorhabditis remanei]|uniref:Uncharacterized protein n=1 Tax=Caenorhabditis remanei TaxID=31234 RepID=A0A6A5G444_CAERE|nr:hypothetical protein GCK72_026247 [Caenorhabditis remanei]KAF1749778.1 hypothetical protein GCK72_026247 [Caenorhabditis remanei]